ncbi:MAG: hypothetical protein KAX30_05370, partial [Candidatus Atribacteria bacterium]|nr:hypothetical protein [Candidatus Atribacteria bacterium]
STGSMRDAESTLDQVIAYCGKDISLQSVRDILGIIKEDIFYDFIEIIIKNDMAKGIEIINQISDSGGDPSQFVKNLMEYVHNLSLVKFCTQESLDFKGIFTEDRERVLKQSSLIEVEKLFTIVNHLAEVEKKMKYTHHPWILLEMLVIKFTTGGNYSLKEIEEEKDTAQLDRKLDKKKVEKKEKILPEKTVQNKVKEKELPVHSTKNSTGIDLEKIWPKILGKIKKTKMSVYSFIIANNLLAIENDRLIIGFNKKYVFHKESLEKKSNKSLLKELIKEEIGRPLIIECIINNKEDSALEVKAGNDGKVVVEGNKEEEIVEKNNIKKNKNKISEDNLLLKESLNLFKGTVIEE